MLRAHEGAGRIASADGLQNATNFLENFARAAFLRLRSIASLNSFFARVHAQQGEQNTDPDEIVDVCRVSESGLQDMIDSGEIVDAKTIAIWHL